MAEHLEALESVLWIGGPPGAGKTTVASILARRHGLRLYSADTRTWAHRDRAIARGVAAAIRWEALAPEQRRAAQDDELVAMSLYRERGPMVVEDVVALPRWPLIIAEGSVIRPADVPPRAAAVWLFADSSALDERLTGRDGSSNRLYELLIDVVHNDVDAARAPSIAATTLDETVATVEAAFADQLARGPLATTVEERRPLLREANLDVVKQVRGYFARPWATGDAEGVVRSFICECGESECAAFVEATLRDAATEPLIATDHALRAETQN